MRKKIILSVGVIFILLVVWLISNYILGMVAVGPNPVFIFSKNFKIVRSDLLYIKDGTEGLDYRQSFPFEETVSAFYANDDWLLGRTEKGYFAVNLQSQEMYYPLNSEKELYDITTISVNRDNWIDSYEKKMTSDYLCKNQAVLSVRRIMNYSFMVLIPIFCILFVIWIVHTKSPIKK